MWYELRIKIYFLHVDIQFSQHRLLKGLSFPHGVLAPLSRLMSPHEQELFPGPSILCP